jgi:hypothetical protein
MKKDDVKVGKTYQAKVSGRLTEVRITAVNTHGGWDAVNVLTNKTVRIKSAQRLRGEALHGKKGKKARTAATQAAPEAPTAAPVANAAPAATEPTTEAPKARKARQREDGKMSGLDACAKVLEESGQPMTTREMFDAMANKRYWTTDAPTPANTLYSAILREITTKGDASRFIKAERGKFALRT